MASVAGLRTLSSNFLNNPLWDAECMASHLAHDTGYLTWPFENIAAKEKGFKILC